MFPFDPTHAKQVAEFTHDAPLLSCCFDPSGRWLLAGGQRAGFVGIELESGTKTVLDGHASWVGAIARATKECVVTGDFSGRLIAWDFRGEQPQVRWSIEAHPTTIHSVDVSLDDQWVATGGSDGTVRLWQLADGKAVRTIADMVEPVYAVAFHPDGTHVIAADRRPRTLRVKQWELTTGKEVRVWDASPLSAYRNVEDIEWGGVRSLAVSRDGKWLAATGRHQYAGPGCVLLWNLSADEPPRKRLIAFKGPLRAARFHAQGFLVTAGGDVAKGEVQFWNVDQEAPLATIAVPGPVQGLDLHPSAPRFAVAQLTGKGSAAETGSATIFEWPTNG